MSKIAIDRAVVEQALEALTNCCSTHGHRCSRCDSEVDEGGNVAAALCAALEHPQDHFPNAGNRVPTGWKLVPVEPTKDMKAAGAFAAMDQVRRSYNPPSAYIPVDSMALLSYRAMIAAAPQPQVEHEPVAWAEEIIEYLHAHYDTEMIKELDSGDALIRLDDAIAAVEEVEQRYPHPQPPRQPLTHEWIRMIYDECDAETGDEFVFAFARDIERAHGITGEQE